MKKKFSRKHAQRINPKRIQTQIQPFKKPASANSINGLLSVLYHRISFF